MGAFIHPLTDWGFKRIFGDKELLMDFLNSLLDYWIYNLVNMDKLKEISFKDRKAIFDKLERIASQANPSKEERARLDEDWKNYNDFFNTMDYAKEEGRKEGIIEGREEGRAEGLAEGEHKKNLENAKGFKEAGTPIAIIAQVTGLSIEEIENL